MVKTVAILGCGNRGFAYGRLLHERKELWKIVSLCDVREQSLKLLGEAFDVDESERFLSAEEFLSKKRADVIVISTLLKTHVPYCIKALSLGYDVLLEKPITENKDELKALLEAQKKYGGKILVCHVLRYAPAFTTVKKAIDDGKIGRLIGIQALEQVSYTNMLHSFVRGVWRKITDETPAPIVLEKSCHDLDLLQWYANSKCKKISSIGSLDYFKRENAPEDAADRCVDCKYVKTCPFSAKTLYVDRWVEGQKAGLPGNTWPYKTLTVVPPTEELLMKSVKESDYGLCAYKCDNEVADNQEIMLEFENGVKATLTIMGLTATNGRIMKFFGSKGEITLNETDSVITIREFGKEPEIINISGLIERDGYAHGGGDFVMIKTLHDMITGKIELECTLEKSVESHLMGIFAEQSRKCGGVPLYIRDEKGRIL